MSQTTAEFGSCDCVTFSRTTSFHQWSFSSRNHLISPRKLAFMVGIGSKESWFIRNQLAVNRFWSKKACFGYKTGGYIFHISIRAFDRIINRVIDDEIFKMSILTRARNAQKVSSQVKPISFGPFERTSIVSSIFRADTTYNSGVQNCIHIFELLPTLFWTENSKRSYYFIISAPKWWCPTNWRSSKTRLLIWRWKREIQSNQKLLHFTIKRNFIDLRKRRCWCHSGKEQFLRRTGKISSQPNFTPILSQIYPHYIPILSHFSSILPPTEISPWVTIYPGSLLP